MKIAYFDCQFGAAGDMLLGALIAAMNNCGIDDSLWFREMDKIALPKNSFTVDVSAVIKGNIASKQVRVSFEDTQEERHLSEILTIIEKSAISEKAKLLAAESFRNLAISEAEVHGVDVEEVHFHEVGAIDAIVDIVGFAVAYDMLRIEQSIVSALPVGSGCVKSAHGFFPIPGPAVLNLLSRAEAPIQQSEIATKINYECLTPTGAAILTTIAQGWGSCPQMDKMLSIGYGAGTYEPEGWPNVSRVVVGEKLGVASGKQDSRFTQEDVCLIEANVDDMSPQVLSYAINRLLEAGALDVFTTPCTMKKGRNGSLISVICRTEDQVVMQELMLTETSSIGVRAQLCKRLVAERQWRTVALGTGDNVRVKIAMDASGKCINIQPEYEDCASYARKHGQPLKQVLNEALVGFQNQRD